MGRIKALPDGTYAVLSRSEAKSGKWYRVDPFHQVCPCPAFYYQGHCNHRKLLISLGLWNTDSRSPRAQAVLGGADAG